MTDEIEPRSQAEKDATAWWSRQIFTLLLLSNAGGVLAVAGFAGSTENIELAAFFGVPTMAYFLTGSAAASFGVIFQFLYTSWRLEAVAEHDSKRKALARKNGQDFRANIAATLAFAFVMAGTLVSFGGAIGYFIAGAREIALSISALDCARSDAEECNSYWFLDGRVEQERVRQASSLLEPGLVRNDIAQLRQRIGRFALPETLPEGTSRRSAAMMEAAAIYALQSNPTCEAVILVELTSSDTDRMIVTCQTQTGVTEQVISGARLLR